MFAICYDLAPDQEQRRREVHRLAMRWAEEGSVGSANHHRLNIHRCPICRFLIVTAECLYCQLKGGAL